MPSDHEGVADRRRLLALVLRVAGLGDGLHVEGRERRQRLGERWVAERRVLDRAGHGRKGRRVRIGLLVRLGRRRVERRQRLLELAVGDDRLRALLGFGRVGGCRLRLRGQRRGQDAPGDCSG